VIHKGGSFGSELFRICEISGTTSNSLKGLLRLLLKKSPRLDTGHLRMVNCPCFEACLSKGGDSVSFDGISREGDEASGAESRRGLKPLREVWMGRGMGDGFGKAALLMGALVFSLTAGEIIFALFLPAPGVGPDILGRIYRVQNRPPEESPSVCLDDGCGNLTLMKPGQAGTTEMPGVFRFKWSIDSKGFRGAPENSGTKILVLGDSQTFGFGVEDDETYPAVLEKMLRGRGYDVTVYNAGVPGHSTAHELRNLKRLSNIIRPHLVVVGVYIIDSLVSRDEGNDLWKNYLSDAPEREQEYRADKIYFLRSHSHLYNRAAQLKQRLAGSSYETLMKKHLHAEDDDNRMAWEATRGLMREIEAFSAAQFGAPAMFFYIPSELSVKLGDTVTLNKLKESESHVISPYDRLYAETKGRPDQFVIRTDGHWDARVHRLFAEVLFDALTREDAPLQLIRENNEGFEPGSA